MRTISTNHFKYLASLMMAAMTALLVSCGGSGTATTTTTTNPSGAASVQLLVSSPQMPSSGASTVSITATVLTSTGQIVSGQAVVFSTNNDPTAYISGVSGVSDNNGAVTATLNLGSNRTNRTINLSATAGPAVGINNVAVTGTAITSSGNSSLASGASTPIVFTVSDSAGAAISGATISVSSQAGNAISTSATTTDSHGQITATVTATTTATSDVITATAAGAVKNHSLTINNSTFAITAPAANARILIGPTTTPVSLTWKDGTGSPVSASSVTFSSTLGNLTSATATTDASGVATTSVSSTSTGSAVISANGPNGTPSTSINVTFYTNTASSIGVQANPGTVQATTGVAGQTGNSSVISVVVRDAASNLVQNAQVNFARTTDSTGGHLSAGTATTDIYGTASVNYIAGGSSSAQNGVTITATVVNVNGFAITPVSNTVNLTVSGQSFSINLGTDNLVVSIPPSNQKTFTATVTDSSNNPIPGASVTFKLRPNRYFKGQYNPGATTWVRSVSTPCAQEDSGAGVDSTLAFNGVLDTNITNPGGGAALTEDTNGNGILDPGNGTASILSSGLTDSYGRAFATITYAKDHSGWVEFIIEARASVNSNIAAAYATFLLIGPASDYASLTVSPPGQLSPYGIDGVCTDAF